MTLRTGHTALPTNCPRGAQLGDGWWRKIADFGNQILRGGLNNALDVTLTANAASTTVTDNRIGGSTRLAFAPMSANAAAELGAGTLYYDVPTQFSVVIHHANNAQTDRTLSVLIGG